ncbi:Phosphoglycerate dehydrogenase [Micromonospora viridifaciens]|uniref:Phosphoglycerate dehydrogenase n=1 Tax=Micromonospora viridifaciens TaxID=1881 RepID=A0A1C4X0W4_MICVI|nr:D-2-hydroxyacid dehydrogenase [Micromonospora viridifaciens]SCF01741.1 Phosphoglycerate dehydrogenase [Micromonospora viridifaciens]
MPEQQNQLRLAVATLVPDEVCAWLAAAEPRIVLLRNPALLPPKRYGGDHHGEPSWRRAPEQQEQFEDMLNSADALYGIPDQSPELLRKITQTNPRLRWVQTMAAGGAAQVAAARLDPATRHRIAFTTSAGVHEPTLTEFALLGLLAGAKNLPRLLADQRAHHWPQRWPMGQLHEQHVVVVGLGHLGQGIARTVAALGARVTAVNRTRRDVPGVDEVAPLDQLAEVARSADALVVTLPASPQTTGLVDGKVLTSLRCGATVVNIGRGNVIDEEALIATLSSRQVGFAALDVTAAEPLPENSPLWDLPNVLISPHTAALSPREDQRIAELVLENSRRLLDGRELLNRIPETDLT